MKTVNIKGKEYVEVNERVKYFRENFEDWSIETELLSNENGVCVIKAIVKNPDGIVKATGHAYENEGSTFINKTSYIENCETSAVGRALGLLGIGIDTSIASSEEVENAINNQRDDKNTKRFDDITELQERYLNKNKVDFDELREKFSKMKKDELRRAYVETNMSKDYTDKQREAILEMILAVIKKAQETAEE